MSDYSLKYDDLPFWSAPFGMVLLDTILYKPDLKVLDIGSGSGFPMLELAGRLGTGSMIYGLDPSPDAVAMIGEKIRLKGIPNASVTQGLAEEIPFADGFFDLVVSNNGLNNVTRQDVSLAECYRVTKPGSQMVVTMNLPGTFIAFYDILQESMEFFRVPDAGSRIREHIFDKRKPVDHLERLLSQSQFRVKSKVLHEFAYRFASAEAFFNHYLIHHFFMPPWQRFIPLEIFGSVMEQARERLEARRSEAGIPEMTVPFVCFDCEREGSAGK